MAKYRVDTDKGSYEVETEDAPATSAAGPSASKPALYGHPGYQSKAPGIIGRMDNAVSDSVDAMATGAQKLFGSGKTTDERLGGASQAARGFLNSAGLPFMLQAGVAAPARVAKGVVTGLVGQKVGSETAKALGAGPGTQDFVGDATGLVTGAAGSQVPVGRASSALYQSGKAGIKALPVVGKMAKAGMEDWRKSAPDYVDPKVARQTELTAQAGERAKARVQATAEARAKLKADAEAASAPPQYGVASTPAGVVPQAPPASAPPVSSAPPAGSPSLPTAALYGMPPRPVAPQGGPPLRPPMNPPPPDIPEGPVTRLLEIGRRNAGLNRSVLRPPVAPPPSGPPPPAEAVAAQVPKVEPAPPPPVNGAPPVTNGGGPSAPEGSAVIPPVAGRPNRYGDMGGKLGEQVARDAHAKDTAVAKYLTEIKVTQGQFRAADAAQRARWAREANPKYKGYTDPDRIDDLANLLPPDAPAAPAGPTLYQGKQQ